MTELEKKAFAEVARASMPDKKGMTRQSEPCLF
jgi:hypothetical protein